MTHAFLHAMSLERSPSEGTMASENDRRDDPVRGEMGSTTFLQFTIAFEGRQFVDFLNDMKPGRPTAIEVI